MIDSTSFFRRSSMRSISRFGRCQGGAMFHSKPVHLARELVAKFLEQRRVHQ